MYTAQNGEQLSCVYGKTLFQHLFSLRSCEKGQIYSLGSGLTQNMDTFFPPNMSSFQSQMVLFKKNFINALLFKASKQQFKKGTEIERKV